MRVIWLWIIFILFNFDEINGDTYHYRVLRKICPTGTYHDPIRDKCRRVPGGGEVVKFNLDARCSKGFTGLLPYDKKSRYYYVCKSSAVLTCACKPNEKFNRIRLRCEGKETKNTGIIRERYTDTVVDNIMEKYKCTIMNGHYQNGECWMPTTERYVTFPSYENETPDPSQLLNIYNYIRTLQSLKDESLESKTEPPPPTIYIDPPTSTTTYEYVTIKASNPKPSKTRPKGSQQSAEKELNNLRKIWGITEAPEKVNEPIQTISDVKGHQEPITEEIGTSTNKPEDNTTIKEIIPTILPEVTSVFNEISIPTSSNPDLISTTELGTTSEIPTSTKVLIETPTIADELKMISTEESKTISTTIFPETTSISNELEINPTTNNPSIEIIVPEITTNKLDSTTLLPESTSLSNEEETSNTSTNINIIVSDTTYIPNKQEMDSTTFFPETTSLSDEQESIPTTSNPSVNSETSLPEINKIEIDETTEKLQETSTTVRNSEPITTEKDFLMTGKSSGGDDILTTTLLPETTDYSTSTIKPTTSRIVQKTFVDFDEEKDSPEYMYEYFYEDEPQKVLHTKDVEKSKKNKARSDTDHETTQKTPENYGEKSNQLPVSPIIDELSTQSPLIDSTTLVAETSTLQEISPELTTLFTTEPSNDMTTISTIDGRNLNDDYFSTLDTTTKIFYKTTTPESFDTTTIQTINAPENLILPSSAMKNNIENDSTKRDLNKDRTTTENFVTVEKIIQTTTELPESTTEIEISTTYLVSSSPYPFSTSSMKPKNPLYWQDPAKKEAIEYYYDYEDYEVDENGNPLHKNEEGNPKKIEADNTSHDGKKVVKQRRDNSFEYYVESISASREQRKSMSEFYNDYF